MWRSLLFVPVLEDRFVAKAATRGADAIVLDLEASVAPEMKDAARRALPDAARRLAPHVPVTVRINPLWLPALKDLEACVMPEVTSIHIAQCESAEHVRAIAGIVAELEAERSLPTGAITLVAMLESADAMTRVKEIASASPRLVGMTLGVEDHATSMGVTTSSDLLRPAVYQLNQAAHAAGIASYAVPASMASFGDLSALETEARYARSIGSAGGYAVHPAQVEILKTVFSPTPDELTWAKDVIEAAEHARQGGKAVFKVAGQMIDQPLITRARRILETSVPNT
ncbi:MAG: CoA ester lyase [Pseudomonadota bacterium]